MKKFFLVAAVSLFGFSLSAQQITKFAVVDTAKIYTAYYRDSSAVRKYEQRKEEFQNSVDSLTNEIKELQTKKNELSNAGDKTGALALQTEIAEKVQYLQEYTKFKNAELETIKKNLATSDDFYKNLYNTIANVAEAEGCSIVLSLQNDKSILWYSPSVDITKKVINEMKF